MKKKQTWIQQADNAIKRAAKKARDLSYRTDTPFFVLIDGKIVNLMASEKSPVIGEDTVP